MTASADRGFPDGAAAGSSAYVLVGPTAVGKSEVVHRIANRYGLDILSADSMGVYRGMDIGTAKPSREQRGDVRYWGVDLVDAGESFSTGAYLEHAAEAFRAAERAGRPLLVAGGTGMYVQALIRGLDVAAAPPPAVREQVRCWFEEGGLERVRAELNARAPDRLEGLEDSRNPRRVMRALERVLAGEEEPTGWKDRPRPRVVGLTGTREVLEARIASRVHRMFDGGLVEEVKRLRERVGDFSVTAGKGIGYAEALGLLDGTCTREEAIRRTVIRTRRLAKRQRTWCAYQFEVDWIRMEEGASVEAVALRVVEAWRARGPTPMRTGTKG